MKKLRILLPVLCLCAAMLFAPARAERPESLMILVNKQCALPSDYVPSDMVRPDVAYAEGVIESRKQMREPAARALEKMFDAALEDGITLLAISGYRSYGTQAAIYSARLEERGQAYVDRYIARPGRSEHQTGLAMDLGCPGHTWLETSFAKTDAYAWLLEHCGEYGFIIRYREELVEETGYAFEPWHVRYVGEPAAEIMERGISLEAYVQEQLEGVHLLQDRVLP